MEPLQQQIREQQKESWNKFSPGWKKWDEFNMAFLKPMGDTIINDLKIKGNDRILDIATGTGEPGLSIAMLTPNGKVTGTDLSERMLHIAQSNAQIKGINNYETIVADVCELPFADGSFDAISCRMGFMFFPDIYLAGREMFRVLKPGGRISTSVWASPDLNNWITTIMSIIQKHTALQSPASGSPGMFRCAAPNVMTDLFKQSGFKNIREKAIKGTVDYLNFNRYWEVMLDVGAPIVAAMAGADHLIKEIIKKETAELYQSRSKNGSNSLNYASIIIYGEK